MRDMVIVSNASIMKSMVNNVMITANAGLKNTAYGSGIYTVTVVRKDIASKKTMSSIENRTTHLGILYSLYMIASLIGAKTTKVNTTARIAIDCVIAQITPSMPVVEMSMSWYNTK